MPKDQIESPSPKSLAAPVPGKEQAAAEAASVPQVDMPKTVGVMAPASYPQAQGNVAPIVQAAMQGAPIIQQKPIEEATPSEIAASLLRGTDIVSPVGVEKGPQEESKFGGYTFGRFEDGWRVSLPNEKRQAQWYPIFDDRAYTARETLRERIHMATLVADVPGMALGMAGGPGGWGTMAARSAGVGITTGMANYLKSQIPAVNKMEEILGDKTSPFATALAATTGQFGGEVFGKVVSKIFGNKVREGKDFQDAVFAFSNTIAKKQDEIKAALAAGAPEGGILTAILAGEPETHSFLGAIKQMSKDDPEFAATMLQRAVEQAKGVDRALVNLRDNLGKDVVDAPAIRMAGGVETTGIKRAKMELGKALDREYQRIDQLAGEGKLPRVALEELVFRPFEEASADMRRLGGNISSRGAQGEPRWEAILEQNFGALKPESKQALAELISRVKDPNPFTERANTMRRQMDTTLGDASFTAVNMFKPNKDPMGYSLSDLRTLRKDVFDYLQKVNAFEGGKNTQLVKVFRGVYDDIRQLENNITDGVLLRQMDMPLSEVQATASRIKQYRRINRSIEDSFSEMEKQVLENPSDFGSLLLSPRVSERNIKAINNLAEAGLPGGINLKKEVVGGMMDALRKEITQESPFGSAVEFTSPRAMYKKLQDSSTASKFETLLGEEGFNKLQIILKTAAGIEEAASKMSPEATKGHLNRLVTQALQLASYMPDYRLGLTLRGISRAVANKRAPQEATELALAMNDSIERSLDLLQRKAQKEAPGVTAKALASPYFEKGVRGVVQPTLTGATFLRKKLQDEESPGYAKER